MEKTSRIYIAGQRGLVGSALLRKLTAAGYTNLLYRTHQELDLLNQDAVHRFFSEHRPEYVFVAAAKVGGILFNKNYQADFLYENLLIILNLVHAAAEYDVKKLMFLGSSCIYPRDAAQPIREDSLLTGPLEPTNEGYAIAKIAGLKLCEKYYQQYGKCFISVTPGGLYGVGDNFHPDHSHVVPGMMRRFHEAKTKGEKAVVLWGSGTPTREFLYVDDLAEALLILMQRYSEPATINVGSGVETPISELAGLMKEIVGFPGEIVFDRDKPDGMPRKVLDISNLETLGGWTPRTLLKDGLAKTYQWALRERIFESSK